MAKLATELDWLDLIDEYKFLIHPRIAGHGPTLYQGGLLSTRRLELISAKPLRSGAVAVHYRRESCLRAASSRPAALMSAMGRNRTLCGDGWDLMTII